MFLKHKLLLREHRSREDDNLQNYTEKIELHIPFGTKSEKNVKDGRNCRMNQPVREL